MANQCPRCDGPLNHDDNAQCVCPNCQYSWLPVKPEWLIWSIEHNMWWGPAHDGYVESRVLAGRYDFDEACEITRKANMHHSEDAEEPYETMVMDY